MIYQGDQATYVPFYTPGGDYGIVASATTGKLAIVEAVIQNRSGGSQVVALATNFKDSDFKVMRYGNVTTLVVGTDVTDKIQTGTTFTAFPDTHNAGVIIGAKVPFGIINVYVDSASAADPGYIFSYFSTSDTQTNFTPALNEPSTFAVGYTNIVFAPPANWGKGMSATVDPNGLLDDYYCIRIVGSHATDASQTWKAISVGRVPFALGSVEDDDYLSVNPREDIPLRDGEGVGYFIYSSTTDCFGTVGIKEIKTP